MSWLDSMSAEKDHGVPVDTKLGMRFQWALVANKANSLLDCMTLGVDDRSRDPSCLLSPGDATSEVLGLVLGSPV